MTRRAHRDPRSLLELRRLAYRAQRNAAVREVLDDALLETFPVYEEYRNEALERSTREGRPYAVLFSFWLQALRRYGRTYPSVLFDIYSLEYARSRFTKDEVIAYVTPSFKRSIEPGMRVYFTKGAASQRSSWKPGYYIVQGESRRGGNHLIDEDRQSESGELSYLLAKSPRGGSLWALASNTRRLATRTRKRGSL